ncbi:MAG TPA: hypothetical protein VE863_08735 [Pyrinomonadaceae bacterium]|nr:hypothetical protein [Pyrinomonadaceae bacterium]
MENNSHLASCCNDLCSAVRNRYFYGKLLDVFHFELEQRYFNNKRWLLNRLVGGYGVVCGLGVTLADDGQSVIVSAGLAIDKCGREIVICQPSNPFPLPAPPADSADAKKKWDPCDECYINLSICYQECPIDPVPTLGGDCDTQGPCAPGAIVERYRLEKADGPLPPVSVLSKIPNAIANNEVQYDVLANYVTDGCVKPDEDCCIPLANIRIPGPGQKYDQNCIDIAVRPIVYTNDLLYQLILAMNPAQNHSRNQKP